MIGEIPCYQSPDKCPMHGGSWEVRPKTKKPTKTTTELTRLRRENADMARALDDAIEIQKKAVADAYRRGAEAMRESIMSTDQMADLRIVRGMENFMPMIDEIIKAMKGRIKELPIPEDK
jgi:soluble cytochrome b562